MNTNRDDSPLGTQVGGDHYHKLAIQPIELFMANGTPFAEGTICKYVLRWKDKGGVVKCGAMLARRITFSDRPANDQCCGDDQQILD